MYLIRTPGRKLRSLRTSKRTLHAGRMGLDAAKVIFPPEWVSHRGIYHGSATVSPPEQLPIAPQTPNVDGPDH